MRLIWAGALLVFAVVNSEQLVLMVFGLLGAAWFGAAHFFNRIRFDQQRSKACDRNAELPIRGPDDDHEFLQRLNMQIQRERGDGYSG